MGTDGAQFPEPDIEAGPKGPPPEPPAAMEAPVEPQLSEPAQMVASQPTTFDVPPDHGPVASVPPEEAFDPQEQADMVSHMNNLLRDSPVLASGPMNPLGNDVFSKAAGGELLGSLLATSDPDALDLRALNTAPADGTPFTPEAQLENHTLLVNAAASVGAAVPQIHETQLLYAPQHKQVALHQAYNIIKHGLLSKINAQALPHLAALLEDGEKPGQVPPEALLARWINKNVDDYLQQHPQDRRRLPTDHIVNDALVGDITAQLAMALHQVAKEPLFSIGSTILPTVPIVEAIGSAPPQSGAWGQHGAMDPVALESAAAPTQPVAPQPAGVAPPSSWPVESSQAAHERLPTSAGGAGGMAVPRGIGPGLIHLTNDPSLAHSSANMPTVSSVPAVAPGPVAAGDASSSGWARDPLASTLERGLPATAVVPQLAAGAAGDDLRVAQHGP